ncbi:MAG: response regulator transcription factor [Desulfatibacillum sp.]|nr:response regulator transcription factor [Desulfatibacillum sp.]
MDSQKPILVIDDDVELCELLQDFLTPEGFTVEPVHESRQGVERALSGDHSMVVLDVMLPGMSGFDVLRHIRVESSIPIIMLTARGDDVDKIVGLEMGADDYLPKPFNPRELVARIRAIQRRAVSSNSREQTPGDNKKSLSLGNVVLCPMTRAVTLDNQEIALTAVEFSLLHELMLNAGAVVSRDGLAEKVLGRSLAPFDRSIDVHVASLRKKLGHECRGRERIRTVRGVGYLYALQPND